MFDAEPEGWARLRLRDLFEERKERGCRGLPIASVSIESGLVLRSTLDRRVESALSDEDHALVKKNDIVYNMMRMWQGACGLASSDCLVSPAYVVMTPSSAIFPDFALVMLRSPEVVRLLHAYSHGVVDDRLRLYPDAFGQIPVSLPPLDEQRRIAGVLRSVEEAIAATKAVADQLDASIRATIEGFVRSSVGEADRLPIAQLALFVGSGVTPKGGKEAYLSAGIPLIRSQNVHFDGLRKNGLAFIDAQTDKKMARTRVQPHDVLLNITGASIGRCTTVPNDFGPGNVNQHVCIIRTDRSRMHPTFLATFLSSHDGQRQINQLQGGLSREGLNFQQVRAIEVPVPTTDAQRVLIETISAMRAAATSTAENLAKLQDLKSGLTGELLSGRVRVPA